MKDKKVSPYKRLLNDVLFYKGLCDKLTLKIDEQNKRLNLLEKIVSGPPTTMIACEKIVEAATQLTCSAISIIKEVKNVT